jgi:hypothetical protein
MPERIADLRTNIPTVDDAKAMMASIAQAEAALALKAARVDLKVKRLIAEHDDAVAADRFSLDNLKTELSQFITANRHLFKKPRKIKTSFGTFGLQDVAEVVVVDSDRAVKWCESNQMHGLLKIETKLVKPALRKAIEEGLKVPGVTIKTGDTVVMTVAESIIQESRQRAEQEG